MRYGLSTKKSIAIYEVGFSDNHAWMKLALQAVFAVCQTHPWYQVL